jgi:hypothetical protein
MALCRQARENNINFTLKIDKLERVGQGDKVIKFSCHPLCYVCCTEQCRDFHIWNQIIRFLDVANLSSHQKSDCPGTNEMLKDLKIGIQILALQRNQRVTNLAIFFIMLANIAD